SVDDQLRTNVPGIWALGDANGRGAFTHTSYNDGEIVVANLLDNDPRRLSDRINAYALFTDPPLGRIGMSETEVRAPGKPALFGIELPIIQAPMAGVQGSPLAIAVSNAGGLGSLPCAMLGPDAMRAELAAIKAQTTKPYNVNFFCHPTPAPDPAREAAWRA